MLSVPDRQKNLRPTSVVAAVCLMFLCSCATENPARLRLPADVSMNKDAGRGGLVIVMLRLESGEKLPFVVDTGCPITVFDKALEPKLGKRLDTGTFWNFGVEQESGRFAAPKLLWGNTLLMTGTNVVTIDRKQLSSNVDHPFMGILGMDVLEHYCIQLDFAAGKMRFLDDERANKKGWGKPFPLTDTVDGCFAVGENLVGAKGSESLIDTGCDYDGWLTPKLFQQWTNQMQLTPDGEARSPNGVLDGETYHELDLHGLDAKLLLSDDSHIKFNGIGLHVLSQNLVTLDFPRRTMYLKRTSDWPLIDKNRTAAAMTMAKSTLQFLGRLRKQGQLPGWSKNGEGATTAFHFNHVPSPYLDSVTWDARKKGDSSIYHYTVARASKDNPWKLQNAWRTDANGRVVQEYAVP